MWLVGLWLLILTPGASKQECVHSRSQRRQLVNETFLCTNTNFENFVYDFNASIPKAADFKYKHHDTNEITITNSNFPKIYVFRRPLSKEFRFRNLALTNSSVEFIDRGAFQGFLDITRLDLSDNKLSSIDFARSLPLNIKELYLRGNDFETIAGAGLPPLEVLDLSYCKINSIVSNSFASFDDHTLIKINNNNLTSLDVYFQDGISLALDMSFNHIRNITNMGTGISWRSLNASHNRISKISDINCQNCGYSYYRRRIEFIDISSNDLNGIIFLNYFSGIKVTDINLSNASIDSTFDFEILKQVENVADLSNNRLESVTSTTFGYSLVLSELILSNCSISQISEGAFKDLEVTTLNISSNLMTEIKNHTFEKSVISTLDMSKCFIKEIATYAFSGLELTNVLDLSYNRIATLSRDIFENLTDVQTINLSFNSIKHLEDKLFMNCAHLRFLDLSNSEIEIIRSDAFVGDMLLSGLNLRNNSIEELELYLENVRGVLDLRDNRIRDLNLTFLAISSARVVLLSSQHTQKLSKSGVAAAPLTKEIDLSNSNITSIEKDAFANLRNLEVLNLSNNNLGSLEEETFLSLTELLRLDLSNCRLRNLPRNLFAFGNRLRDLRVGFSDAVIATNSFVAFNVLKNLTIGNSGVITLQEHCFNGLISLENLVIDSRNETVKIAPGAFFGLNSLKRADFKIIFKNVHTLETGLFRGLPKMEILDLGGLQLTSIQAEAFVGLTSMEKLLLNHNNLQTIINNTFSTLSNLKILNLSHNRISTLETFAFSGLEHLEIISISNNNLTRLALGTFQHFPNLRVMDLHKNHINKLVTGTFSNLKLLEDLDLSYNNITKFKFQALMPLGGLRNLELTGNHLIQMSHLDLIRALRRLEFIGINANKWKCDYLASMLISFQNYSIQWVSEKSRIFSHENIDGIKCYDICKFFYCVDEAESVWGAR